MRLVGLLSLVVVLGACRKDDDEDDDGFALASDCNDTDAAVYPGAAEACNAIDDDCDTVVDEEPIDGTTFYADGDGDGSGSAGGTVSACAAPTGFVASSDDCDDADPERFPSATEDDCTDPVDYNCDGSSGYDDADDDGFAACKDCDDKAWSVNPGAIELCGGADENCDGEVDEDGAVGGLVWYADTDADGFGDAAGAVTACEAPTGYVSNANDCDDAAVGIHPGATETCDKADQDCDGDIDENATDAIVFYADSDGDNHGGDTFTMKACEAPSGYATSKDDCDDLDAETFPGATELCDAEDNDCDNVIPAGELATLYRDADGDGHGNLSAPVDACDATASDVASSDDCDDLSQTTFPTAVEICDGRDNDCDAALPTDEADADSDGVSTCEGDCNDLDGAVVPQGIESCNSIDDDCDGKIDEAGAVNTTTFYADADGDGYGTAVTTEACALPTGWATQAGDCNDAAALALPGGTEICDALDNDCNGTADADVDVLGAASKCAGLSCQDIKTRRPAGPTGAYYIDPDAGGPNAPFRAFCDQTNAAGGWTLLVGATASGTTFGNNSAEWRGSSEIGTLPTTFAVSTDYRSPAFAQLPTNSIRLCYQNGTRCYNFNHNYGIALRTFFTNNVTYTEYSAGSFGYTNVGTVTSMNNYRTQIGLPTWNQTCFWLGINEQRSISAIGLLMDANGGCTGTGFAYHDDGALGLGLQSCTDNNGCTNGGTGHHNGDTRGVNSIDDSGDFGPWFVLGK